MRLLDTHTLEIKEFEHTYALRYAILSHTWGDQEVSFEYMSGNREALRTLRGYQKVARFCEEARNRGFKYGWVDTCCIDKRSSAELSEAINSMYRYYSGATVCIIYLSDVFIQDKRTMVDSIKACRWLSRGWTLQELIAASNRRFFDADWNLIKDNEELLGAIAEATGIPQPVLYGERFLSSFSVAERMCWASKRKTTRAEDIAYCLMGIFDVNMTPMYGEGAPKAFKRLQLEIMKSSFDQTLFAWRGQRSSSGLLARTPSYFSDTPQLLLWSPRYLAPYQMTNVGLSIRVIDITARATQEKGASKVPTSNRQNEPILAVLQCEVKQNRELHTLALYLESVRDVGFWVNGSTLKAYRRVRCSEWCLVPSKLLIGLDFQEVIVLEDVHMSLVLASKKSDYQKLADRLQNS